MTKKTTAKGATKKDDPEQSRRFVETAKAVEADKTGELFERAIDSVASDANKNKSDK